MFRVEFSGEMMHVGIPVSQTMLTEKERSLLPDVFLAAGLDPTIQYSDAHIAKEVAEHGRGRLLKRTIKRLNGEGSTAQEFRELLLERLQEELAQWESSADSELETEKSTGITKHRPTRVLVNLQYFHVSRTAETRLFSDE